jgi:hypothetical protein
LPSVSGQPALLVCTISSLPALFFTSQAQPEPNWPTAAALNFSLKDDTLPNASSMAARSAPDGSSPPGGFMLCQ